MRNDSKIAANEQGDKVQMRRQIRTLCYHPGRVTIEIEHLVSGGKSHTDARDFVERWINENEDHFLAGPELVLGGPKTKAEHIRFWFPELSEEEAREEAKRDDEFRSRKKSGFPIRAYLRTFSKGMQMVEKLVKQPSKDREEAPEEWETYDRAFTRIMNCVFHRERHPQIRRSAYRRESGRVSRRSSNPVARAAASSSSDDSGGSEPPQGDPDLPAKPSRFGDGFRNGFHHFDNLHHNQRLGNPHNRQLSFSWRPKRPGPMSHVRRQAA